MSIIDTTTGQSYASVSAAILGANAGDTIAVDAGSYVEYFPTIGKDLTIQGVGGLARFTTPGSPTNGKGILVIRGNVVLRNLDISGAAVPDGNGAGIRFETGSLVLTGSHIHDNQDGILANADPGSISIANSEIDHNGAGDGYTHNLYINRVGSFTITDSFIHDAIAGHEIKSRADVTVISNNRIQDQQGDTSYSVDLPNGGAATITGNTVEKGANAQNWTVFHVGGDGRYANTSLTVSNNRIINDLPPGARTRLVSDDAGITPVITGNTLFGFPADSVIPPGNASLALSAAPALDTSSPFAVPEPATAGLLAAALLAGVCLARR